MPEAKIHSIIDLCQVSIGSLMGQGRDITNKTPLEKLLLPKT